MQLMLVPMGIVLIFLFFYGIASGETDHPLWKAGATLMVLLVVFMVYLYRLTV